MAGNLPNLPTNAAVSSSTSTQDVTPPKKCSLIETSGRLLCRLNPKTEIEVSNFITKVVAKVAEDYGEGYIFQINATSGRHWECPLKMSDLCNTQFLMPVLQKKCNNSLWYKTLKEVPSSVDLGSYMYDQTKQYEEGGNIVIRKVAQVFPSWQGHVFIVNEDIQIDVRTGSLLESHHKYVLIPEKSLNKRNNESQAHTIQQPFEADSLNKLFQSLKGLLVNNYPAACMAVGGLVMSLGYNKIAKDKGMCPVVILTGDTETGKSTVLKAIMPITGNVELRDCTGKKALELSKKCDLHYAWDDPSSADDVSFIVQALFNQAGRDTVVSSGKPRRPPIISANFACAHDKRIFSREAIILFQCLNPKHPLNERTQLVRDLESATKQASKGLLDCLKSVIAYVDQRCNDPEDFVSSKVEEHFERVRSQEIYATLMWFTQHVMKIAGVEEDIDAVWEYVEKVLAPFVNGMFNKKCPGPRSADDDSSSSTTIKELEVKAMALSSRELKCDFKLTTHNGSECIAISVAFLSNLEKSVLKEHKLNEKKKTLRFLHKESDVDFFKFFTVMLSRAKLTQKFVFVCLCL